MDDTTKTILIAAGSGTIGAAITQICSLINNYYSDQRKYKSEQGKVIILRKIEVGEVAVQHIGLTIQMFRKLVRYFQEFPKFTTQEAYDRFNIFLDDQKREVEESYSKNSIVNLAPIYFKVDTDFTKSANRDSESATLDAEYGDILSKLKSDASNSTLQIQRLTEIRQELTDHYNLTIQILEADYEIVITEVKRIINLIEQ